MLPAIGLLLGCQLAGETFVHATGLAVPGPVLGLVLLVVLLALAAGCGQVEPARIETTALGRVAGGLLGMLGVLFVPAGVGMIEQFALIRQYGLVLALALLVSTALTLVVTVLTFRAVALWSARR